MHIDNTAGGGRVPSAGGRVPGATYSTAITWGWVCVRAFSVSCLMPNLIFAVSKLHI